MTPRQIEGFCGIPGLDDEEASQRGGISEGRAGHPRPVGKPFAGNGPPMLPRLDRPGPIFGGAIVATTGRTPI